MWNDHRHGAAGRDAVLLTAALLLACSAIVQTTHGLPQVADTSGYWADNSIWTFHAPMGGLDDGIINDGVTVTIGAPLGSNYATILTVGSSTSNSTLILAPGLGAVQVALVLNFKNGARLQVGAGSTMDATTIQFLATPLPFLLRGGGALRAGSGGILNSGTAYPIVFSCATDEPLTIIQIASSGINGYVKFTGGVTMSDGCVWSSSIPGAAIKLDLRGGAVLRGSMTLAAGVNITDGTGFGAVRGGPIIAAALYAPGGVVVYNGTFADGASFVQSTVVSLRFTNLLISGTVRIPYLSMLSSNITLGPTAVLQVDSGQLSGGLNSVYSNGGVISGWLNNPTAGGRVCLEGGPLVAPLASLRITLLAGNLSSCSPSGGVVGLGGRIEFDPYSGAAGDSTYDLPVSSSTTGANVTLGGFGLGGIYLSPRRTDYFTGLTNGAFLLHFSMRFARALAAAASTNTGVRVAVNLYIPPYYELWVPIYRTRLTGKIVFTGPYSRFIIYEPAITYFGTGNFIAFSCPGSDCTGVGVNISAGVEVHSPSVSVSPAPGVFRLDGPPDASESGEFRGGYISGPGCLACAPGEQLWMDQTGWRVTGGLRLAQLGSNSAVTVRRTLVEDVTLTLLYMSGAGVTFFLSRPLVIPTATLNAASLVILPGASGTTVVGTFGQSNDQHINVTAGAEFVYSGGHIGYTTCVPDVFTGAGGTCRLVRTDRSVSNVITYSQYDTEGAGVQMNLTLLSGTLRLASGSLVIGPAVTVYVTSVMNVTASAAAQILLYGTLAAADPLAPATGVNGLPLQFSAFFPRLLIQPGAVVSCHITGVWNAIWATSGGSFTISSPYPINITKLLFNGTMLLASPLVTISNFAVLPRSAIAPAPDGGSALAELVTGDLNLTLATGYENGFTLDRVRWQIASRWRIHADHGTNQILIRNGSRIDSYHPTGVLIAYPALAGGNGADSVVAFNYSIAGIDSVEPAYETLALASGGTFAFAGSAGTSGTVRIGVCVAGTELVYGVNPKVAIGEPANCPAHPPRPLSSTALPLSSTAVPLSSTAVPLSSTAVPLPSTAVSISSSAQAVSSSAAFFPLSSTAAAAADASTGAGNDTCDPNSCVGGDCVPVPDGSNVFTYLCHCTSTFDGTDCQYAYAESITRPSAAGSYEFRLTFRLSALSSSTSFAPADVVGWYARVNTMLRAAAVASGVVSAPIDSVAIVAGTALLDSSTVRVWMRLSPTAASLALRSLLRDLIGHAQLTESDIAITSYNDGDGSGLLMSGALVPAEVVKPTAADAANDNRWLLIGLVIAVAVLIAGLIALQKAVPHSRVSELANVTLSIAMLASNAAFVASLRDSGSGGSAIRFWVSLGLLCASIFGHVIVVFWLVDQDLKRKDFARWMSGPNGFRATAVVSVLAFVAPSNLRLLDSQIANLRVLNAPYSELSNLRITVAGLVSVACVSIPLLVIQTLTALADGWTIQTLISLSLSALSILVNVLMRIWVIRYMTRSRLGNKRYAAGATAGGDTAGATNRDVQPTPAPETGVARNAWGDSAAPNTTAPATVTSGRRANAGLATGGKDAGVTVTTSTAVELAPATSAGINTANAAPAGDAEAGKAALLPPGGLSDAPTPTGDASVAPLSPAQTAAGASAGTTATASGRASIFGAPAATKQLF